ncbi:protein DpdJ [Paenibacillus lautus]|uniref:DEAD/DEAH box helicase n=1 Tax=Paenibacillus lautus TaxID=1401 RepID=A0A385TP84_PAELA|nr:protein DpdJ [Paenibacillus lautus]AYB46270.1 DEAD/DEAH box helicase [Paenibacillus lautus]
MSRTTFDLLTEEILSQLELKENQLLEWGFIGGAIDAREEIASILHMPPTEKIAELAKDYENDLGMTDQVLKHLRDRKLIYEVKEGYRTRYAETIRLLQLLKQRFSFRDWHSGRNLVSGIKPMLASRYYPVRDQALEQIESELPDKILNNTTTIEVIRSQLRYGKYKLSRFQVDSLVHLLSKGWGNEDHGTVIGAGTGAGKTKAFYIPAIAHMASVAAEEPTAWTKTIGIYPRVELLKDQFREAVGELWQVNPSMQDRGIRSLSAGCYYKDTPNIALDVKEHKQRKWDKKDRGYVCPFFSCPECGSEMYWLNEDLNAEIKANDGLHERLVCSSCERIIDESMIRITRARMKLNPPDLLFTTTEMLNRKMNSGSERHLFGIQAHRPPLYVLLDEIHIYEGVGGSHVAYLIRRWRHLMKMRSGASIQFVGLSATLSNAETFLSQLIGLTMDRVTYIHPQEKDMTAEGMEYNVVVRGDPFSGAALLSTSVQTAMLLARMLDPIESDVSRGAWGSKVFGFTDKLDVINRWHHIQLDSERNLLSRLRDPDLIERDDPNLPDYFPQLNLSGQVWLAAKEIKSDSLRRPIAIDITSSQNKGVMESAKFVIATSTLEVGYNDAKVGAVIQHKAPRNIASFLQRKGRAGRTRGMRPWMVVVSSAYGRDRFVYDYPEYIFQPNLDDLWLPLRNPFVQRIQMAFALMDFLMHKIGNDDLDIRRLLTEKGTQNQKETRRIIQQVKKIMEGDDRDWRIFVCNALQLTEVEYVRMMWTPPRSMLMDLLPNLLTRLETRFAKSTDEEKSEPLVGYIPRTLFTSLDISELQLKLPNERTELMTLVQGMVEFAPGNVSKRFVRSDHIQDAHWLEVPNSDLLDLNGSNVKSKLIEIMDWQGEPLKICEAYAFKLSQIPRGVSDRSSTYPQWSSTMTPSVAKGIEINLPEHSTLNSIFNNIEYYSFERNHYVKVTRFYPSVKGETKYESAGRPALPRDISFQFEGQRAALGFQRYTDAICFEIPEINWDEVIGSAEWENVLIQAKPEFYAYLVKKDETISSSLNVFEIGWLAQITISSIVAIAVRRQVEIGEAIEVFKENTSKIARDTLNLIYQSTAASNTFEDEEGRMYQRLLAYVSDELLINEFLNLAWVLEGGPDRHPEFREWLDKTAVTTIAAGIQRAITELLPDLNTEDLLVDIVDRSVWLSESESGGLGIVSKVASSVNHQPNEFESWFVHAVSDCPRHSAAKTLKTVLPLLEYPDFRDLVDRMRIEKRIEKQKEALAELQNLLDAVGIAPKRQVIGSIVNRLLRTGASHLTDGLMLDLQRKWEEEERRLACRVDMNVFSVACVSWDEIARQLDVILSTVEADESRRRRQRYVLIESLLFSDCNDSCPECLELYSPFQSFLKASRILVRQMVPQTHCVIRFSQLGWKETMMDALRNGLRVSLISHASERRECQEALIECLHTPLETAYELYYPFIEGVSNLGQEWQYNLRIREVSHA